MVKLGVLHTGGTRCEMFVIYSCRPGHMGCIYTLQSACTETCCWQMSPLRWLTLGRSCRIDKDVISRLQHVGGSPFKRVSYTEVIDILKQAIQDGKKFEEMDIQWGMDLGSEHERCVLTQPHDQHHYPQVRCTL
jgi:aspartyl/asparaginyl-tRNA synthetase